MQTVADWLREARRKLAARELEETDLDALEALLARPPRQQILYLQTADSSPTSRVVAIRRFLPGEAHGRYGLIEEVPYPSVMAAVEDGWRVVQFPVPPTDFRDDTIEYLGFEFVLEKWEPL